MIKCPNCGGELKFSPKAKKVTCEYCSSTFDPKELKKEAKAAKEVEVTNETIKAKSYKCSQCGAELLTFDETAITFCSYCGSQAMLESRMVNINNPDFIIPFKITKEECIEAYKKEINKAIFAPSYMKDDIVVEKFRGIYMPYRVYKISVHENLALIGNKYSHRKGDYEYYDRYIISGPLDTDYDGLSYDLVSKLFDKYTEHVPYDFTKAEEFNYNYLVGFYADVRDVPEATYQMDAESIVEKDIAKRLKKNKTFAKYGCNNPRAIPKASDKKIGMFPLYFLAIRDKNKNYIHYAVVNGQTGKVAMDIPIDFKKYIFGSLLVAVPIFLILNLGLILLPRGIVVFSVISLVISIIISSNQLDSMGEILLHYDDKGYTTANSISSKEAVKARMKSGEKIKKYLYKQLIGIVLGLIVIFLKPVSDVYYYGVAIINFLIAIWSFYDLVKERNLIVSSKLPQLEKRGGDENE